jgi:hypothetical protein
MTPEQGRRVRDLFEAAVDRDPATVVSWLGREAADDSVVRAEVLSPLDHHSRAGAFLSHPIGEPAIALLADEAPLAPGAQPGMLIGTPAYMAPEQINGLPVDTRADVFAFGVLLYEYACGTHPFAATTALATVARVLESDPPPLGARADVPSRLADLIARCTHKAPTDRFGSAAEVLGALGAADAEGAPALPRASWWRVHQIVVAVLYIAAAAYAWQLKEWVETPLTVAMFLALGATATIGGVLRGRPVFTSLMNLAQLTRERRRTHRATRLLDVADAALLCADAALIAATGALPAVFALASASASRSRHSSSSRRRRPPPSAKNPRTLEP